ERHWIFSPGKHSQTGRKPGPGHSCRQAGIESQQQGRNIYELIDETIESAVPGCKGLYYVPYLCGERCPRWDAYAKGGFYGLKMEHAHRELVRSVVEGIGLNMRVILDIMRKYVDIHDMSIMGGLVKSKSNLHIFADTFNTNLGILNYYDEATSVGAAVLAGVGCGALKGFEEVEKFSWRVDSCEPSQENREVYDRLLKFFDKTYDSMKSIYDML
ncbi:MAG: xylulokinase, partial [Lachnospiraceae bacterium]|nr:xylulokinase [Lachnospiraceae bacterium]